MTNGKNKVTPKASLSPSNTKILNDSAQKVRQLSHMSKIDNMDVFYSDQSTNSNSDLLENILC